MKTVVYSINGKYFLDFGIYISESKGLLDKLKPKPRKSYSWAEQHGIVVDLSKPKYEEREISLKGWIIGESWHDMKAKFDLFLSEFDKGGLARLLIEFGKELVYDVYLADGVELDKEFRDGKMYGLFTIKLKEPNPVKKVLKLVGNGLQLSFTSPDWIDINIDGINESRKDSISINKALQSRAVGGLDLGGRNLIIGSKEMKTNTPAYVTNHKYNGFVIARTTLTSGSYVDVCTLRTSIVPTEREYIASFYAKADRAMDISVIFYNPNTTLTAVSSTGQTVARSDGFVNVSVTNVWKRYWVKWTQGETTTLKHIVIRNSVLGSTLEVAGVCLTSGNKATDWTPAPEDTHYITIAGKTDEIVNLQTNAEIIWE